MSYSEGMCDVLDPLGGPLCSGYGQWLPTGAAILVNSKQSLGGAVRVSQNGSLARRISHRIGLVLSGIGKLLSSDLNPLLCVKITHFSYGKIRSERLGIADVVESILETGCVQQYSENVLRVRVARSEFLPCVRNAPPGFVCQTFFQLPAARNRPTPTSCHQRHLVRQTKTRTR